MLVGRNLAAGLVLHTVDPGLFSGTQIAVLEGIRLHLVDPAFLALQLAGFAGAQLTGLQPAFYPLLLVDVALGFAGSRLRNTGTDTATSKAIIVSCFIIVPLR